MLALGHPTDVSDGLTSCPELVFIQTDVLRAQDPGLQEKEGLARTTYEMAARLNDRQDLLHLLMPGNGPRHRRRSLCLDHGASSPSRTDGCLRACLDAVCEGVFIQLLLKQRQVELAAALASHLDASSLHRKGCIGLKRTAELLGSSSSMGSS